MIYFQELSIALVVEFSYDKERFEDLGSDAGNELLSLYKRHDTSGGYQHNSTWWSNKITREYMFGNNETSGIVWHFEHKALDNNDRIEKKEVPWGLNFKGPYVMQIGEKEVKVFIKAPDVFFWKNGRGFMNVRFTISGTKLDGEECREFIRIISNVLWRSGKTFKGESIKFGVKNLLFGRKSSKEKLEKGFFEVLNTLEVDGRSLNIVASEENVHYLGYGITEDGYFVDKVGLSDEANKEIQEIWEMNEEDYEKRCMKYKKRNNLQWLAFQKGLFMIGKPEYFVQQVLPKNIFANYMMMFQYYLNLKEECENSQGKEVDFFDALQEDYERVITDGDQQHVQDLFKTYLCENVWGLRKKIADAKAKRNHDKFDADAYKRSLPMISKAEETKIPIPKENYERDYVFISYAHDDFKKVYDYLADMYSEGINFCYDVSLIPGERWDVDVERRIKDNHCVGIVFFISETFFCKQSTMEEVALLEKKETSKEYFCVNLENEKPPFDILRGILKDDEKCKQSGMGLERIGLIAKYFDDRITYVLKKEGVNKLFDTIREKFPSVEQK